MNHGNFDGKASVLIRGGLLGDQKLRNSYHTSVSVLEDLTAKRSLNSPILVAMAIDNTYSNANSTLNARAN